MPIPAVLRDHLVEHRMRGTGDGRVFASDRQVRAQAERARRSAGPTRASSALTLHDARHTYASLMIAAGVNAKALSTFMGHANIAITLDLYGHLMPGSEAEAAICSTPTSRARSEAQLPLHFPAPSRPRRRAMRRSMYYI